MNLEKVLKGRCFGAAGRGLGVLGLHAVSVQGSGLLSLEDSVLL